MELSRRQKVIKVEPMRDDNLFYEPGDIVLGGTNKFKPWPCIVRQFLGYDESQVQVYRVDFICTNQYCNLQTEFLIPITNNKLKRLRSSHNYHHQKEKFLKALKIAQKKIIQLEERAKDDEQKMRRFMRLYQSDRNQVDGLIEVDNIHLPTQLQVLEKKRKLKRHKLRFSKQISISIETLNSKNLTTSVITSEGKTFLSNWKIKLPKQEPLDNFVSIDIKNWNSAQQRMEEQ